MKTVRLIGILVAVVAISAPVAYAAAHAASGEPEVLPASSCPDAVAAAEKYGFSPDSFAPAKAGCPTPEEIEASMGEPTSDALTVDQLRKDCLSHDVRDGPCAEVVGDAAGLQAR